MCPRARSGSGQAGARKLERWTRGAILRRMKVTALEIQQKEFARSFRGLDPAEVRAFLDTVAAQVEELARENIDLREELKRREERIADLEGQKKLVQETLVTAQRLTEELQAQARKEAENIIAEAELRAEILLQQANERLADVMGQITEMKRQRALFATQLRQAAEAQLALLDSIGKEPARIEEATVAHLPRAAGAED